MLFSPSLSSLCYFNFDVKLSCFLLWIQHFGNSFSLPSRVPFISCKNYEFLGCFFSNMIIRKRREAS
uniref:Uncharacterized protein n=1 Tax=Manihot esculenta TaxID=3983 RepID=A0A2C9UYT5_MANES